MTSEHVAPRLFPASFSLARPHFLISRMGTICLSQIDRVAQTNNGSESVNYPQGEASWPWFFEHPLSCLQVSASTVPGSYNEQSTPTPERYKGTLTEVVTWPLLRARHY